MLSPYVAYVAEKSEIGCCVKWQVEWIDILVKMNIGGVRVFELQSVSGRLGLGFF